MIRIAVPVTDRDGFLYPEEDTRWVTIATMATYLGLVASTVYRMTLDGEFPKIGLRARGTITRYQPATIYRLKGWGRYARVAPEAAVTA
jgi:hypothetical protein